MVTSASRSWAASTSANRVGSTTWLTVLFTVANAADVPAHSLVTRSALALVVTFNAQIDEPEAPLSEHFEQHPDARSSSPCQD